MTKGEAVNWIINLSADIGKAEYRNLWHYEQALDEIRELLELPSVQPERKRGKWIDFIGRDLGIEGQWLRDDKKTVFLQCDQCASLYVRNFLTYANFCPNCGADMRENIDSKKATNMSEKLQNQPIEHRSRAEYYREYYAKNKEKYKEYRRNYWRRKLKEEGELGDDSGI